MKKKSFAAILVPLCVMLFGGCQKKDLAKAPNRESLIEQARAYFEKEVISSTSHFNGVPNQRQRIQKTPLWDKAYLSGKGMDQIVSVPLKYGQSIGMKAEATSSRAISIDQQSLLIISKDKTGKFQSQITTYIPNEFIQNSTANISGFILIEDWAGNSISKLGIKDGKVYTLHERNDGITGRSESSGTCTVLDWYLCDVDQFGNHSNCQFLYREVLWCDNQSFDPNDQGGGGGGAPGDPCETPDMEQGVETSSQSYSVSVTDIDDVTKYKNPSWICLTSPTFKLISHENGKVKLDDVPTNKWVWLEFSHGSISMEGFTLGGNVSYTQGIGTPSFTPGTSNVLYAGMSLDFSVTYAPLSVTCGGVTIGLPPFTKPYTSTSTFWDAKP